MKNKIIDSIIELIQKYYNYDKKEINKIRYGLESIYLSLFKLIIIILLSFIIHTIKQLCIFLLFYCLLRLTAFGLHTKKSIHCWILSLLTFTLIPYLIKVLIINKNIMLITCLITIIIFIIYSPSDTEKRPLINKRKRLIYKLISLIIVLLYTFLIINNYKYSNYLFFAMILQSLLILPLSYKLLGLKYNNYKRYIRKEV